METATLIEQAKEQIGNSFLGCPNKEQAEEPTGEEEDGQEKDGLTKKSVPFSALVDMLKQTMGREEVSRSQMTPALSKVAPFNASISALDLLGAPTAPTTSTELASLRKQWGTPRESRRGRAPRWGTQLARSGRPCAWWACSSSSPSLSSRSWNQRRQRHGEEGGQLKEGSVKERARNSFLSCRVDNRIPFREDLKSR